VINDVPDGSADLRTWSPDQLTEQTATQKQISGVAVGLDTTLNFTPPKPRRRRS
jgi:hypothetical protein